eukprot:scaffold86664_cov26-Tisochrysis_lutea.AAC.2
MAWNMCMAFGGLEHVSIAKLGLETAEGSDHVPHAQRMGYNSKQGFGHAHSQSQPVKGICG